MSRAHNFSAGPAVLPEAILPELQDAILEFGGTGLGLMEMSHRSKAFDGVIVSAEARLRRLMGVPSDYKVLLLQGGASLQFYMSALNLLAPGDAADFIVTGVWSQKALKECRLCADGAACWDGKATGYTFVPNDGDYVVRDEAAYVAYTSNNTIYGTAWAGLPDGKGHPLVADMSSDICSGPVDVAAHDLIYAGAQKNLGPSGVCAVILSPWAIERSARSSAARGGLPAMLDYKLQAEKASLYNTPNTFGIFALDRVLAWLEGLGGVDAIAQRNARKAAALYAELDRTDFWRPHARTDSRSRMNVTWRTPSAELDARFVAEADAAGLKGLKGHRNTGGLRASLYNACPEESVAALVAFMKAFQAANG